jgi:RNA 3'-phosphate cyclase
MIEVDGAMLEGGGQILRMAITYSSVLGVPVTVHNIRPSRPEPGLKPQHLTTLRAVARICGAECRGLRVGSTEVEYRPGSPRGGAYSFDIGTAGSISLLLQCIAPVAAFADSRLSLRIVGGTSVKWSPPVLLLDKVIWGGFREMGFLGGLSTLREGFYPRGGGVVEAVFDPIVTLKPLSALSGTGIARIRGISLCGRLPFHVAERQARSASDVLKGYGHFVDVEARRLTGVEAPLSPGSVICLWVEAEPRMYLGSSALGERGKPAERVGAEAAAALSEQLDSEVAVDKYTADSLPLVCSIADGVSEYTTSVLTLHTLTAIELARLFTDARFEVDGELDGRARVRCRGVGLRNDALS